MDETNLILVASDIHGRVNAARKLIEKIKEVKPDEVWLLGDFMYNGPRNGVPDDYEPMEVCKLLSSIEQPIRAVCGNCDSRVDAMLLPFDIPNNIKVTVFGKAFGLFHGDLPFPDGEDLDALVSGHTHIPVCTYEDGKYFLNPGSVAFPKGGYPASYALICEKGMKVLSLVSNEEILSCPFAI